MCGIVGIIHRDADGVREASLRSMCSLLTHRGPDDEGFYFGGRAALGMRRLAIIDVDAGRQPVHNEDQSVWVVFNGEIYNYRELRTDLEKRGHRFLASSDTECLVHLYEEFGDDLVSRLRGMFAFAIWDVRKQRLLLARDRLGIKPLYYLLDPDRIAFASEMKCLLGAEGFERKINHQALSEFFTFGYVPGPSTIYEHVVELPPAHVCAWRDGHLDVRRYWQVDPEPDEHKPIGFFVEGLLHHLKEAIRVHLVSDVPLGAFLSGGVDSSAIVALMSQMSDRPVKTFTVGFAGDEPAFDERPFARSVAEAFRTDHAECLLTARVEDLVPTLISAFDEPFADSSAIPNYLICQAARQHVTVALSGLGGDELFAGYERYRGALLAEQYRRLPRHLRRWCADPMIGAIAASRHRGVWTDRFQRFLGGAQLRLRERYQRYITAYEDSEKTELFSGDLAHELRQRGLTSTPLAIKYTNGCDPLNQMLFTDLRTYLPDDELRKADRMSMWNSLEVRVPFLDHKLVEFVATIPARYKIRHWQKKHILLRALRGVLPRSILTRRKQGFSVPLSRWLRGPLRDLVHTVLAERTLSKVGLFEPRTVSRIVAEHEQGLVNHEVKIWTLLTFVVWHELYIQNQMLRSPLEISATTPRPSSRSIGMR